MVNETEGTARAYVITGFMRHDGEQFPVTGVLFSEAQPGCKELRNMGFVQPSMEAAKVPGMYPQEPTLFYFHRTPSPNGVTVAKVGANGVLGRRSTMEGDPMQLIPTIAGAASERLVQRGSLRPSDFPKPASASPQPANGKRRRANSR